MTTLSKKNLPKILRDYQREVIPLIQNIYRSHLYNVFFGFREKNFPLDGLCDAMVGNDERGEDLSHGKIGIMPYKFFQANSNGAGYRPLMALDEFPFPGERAYETSQVLNKILDRLDSISEAVARENPGKEYKKISDEDKRILHVILDLKFIKENWVNTGKFQEACDAAQTLRQNEVDYQRSIRDEVEAQVPSHAQKLLERAKSARAASNIAQ